MLSLILDVTSNSQKRMVGTATVAKKGYDNIIAQPPERPVTRPRAVAPSCNCTLEFMMCAMFLPAKYNLLAVM